MFCGCELLPKMNYLIKVIVVLICYNGNVCAYNWFDIASEKFQRVTLGDCSQVFSRIKDTISNAIQKLKDLWENVTNIGFNPLLERRVIIKNAFHKFIKDSLSESNSTAYHLSEIDTRESQILPSDIISSHGYRAETHSVQTTDGYILTLCRVRSLLKNPITKRNMTILLHHGLLGSSDDWIILGPGKAIPYLLLDRGYDVWLANARGNRYSRAHVNKTVESQEFWNFSWHEIGQFDLPAVFDYIEMVTEGQTQIHFIGHSMGGTALFVLLSKNPQYNWLLRSAVLLAPLVFMSQVRGPLRTLSEFLDKYGSEYLNFSGDAEIMLQQLLTETVVKKFCTGDKTLCMNPLLLLANGGAKTFNDSIVTSIFRYVPAGGSTKTFIHYCQLIQSGEFQEFDRESKRNLNKYERQSPSIYPLNEIKVPISIFSSSDDWLATTEGILKLIPHISTLVMQRVINRYDFTHTDFIWADDAPELIFHLIVDLLDQIKERK